MGKTSSTDSVQSSLFATRVVGVDVALNNFISSSEPSRRGDWNWIHHRHPHSPCVVSRFSLRNSKGRDRSLVGFLRCFQPTRGQKKFEAENEFYCGTKSKFFSCCHFFCLLKMSEEKIFAKMRLNNPIEAKCVWFPGSKAIDVAARALYIEGLKLWMNSLSLYPRCDLLASQEALSGDSSLHSLHQTCNHRLLFPQFAFRKEEITEREKQTSNEGNCK